MKTTLRLFLLLGLLRGTLADAQRLPEIRVTANGQYLETPDGKPFFWLGDTDWELFHRLNREETEQFLETRRRQGFNVIQAVALAEFDGIRTPNRYGDLPLVAEDPTRLATTPGANPANADEYDYWDHVDYVVDLAAKKGLYLGLLPTWGDKVTNLWGEGPRVFTVENARVYGRTLGQRYGKHNVIWILGGDRPVMYKGRAAGDKENQYDDRALWRAMAEGIVEGVGHDPFITYHPWGNAQSTSQQIHGEPWLDMNAFQSGHGSRATPAWDWVTRDLALQPQKPTLDMEPCYEDHPVNPWDGKWTRQRGYFTAPDVRARIYRGVFAGACGVTYGHHQIWQFLNAALYPPINVGDTLIGWQKASTAEAAGQMQYLKALLLSRPYVSRVGDQSLIAAEAGTSYVDRIEATRDAGGAYAMVYLPQSKPVRVDLTKLSGTRVKAWWYDPRTGKVTDAGTHAKAASQEFTPPGIVTPGTGADWVLVLDDASKKFKAPGIR
jgi:hypothetical protein